MGAATDTCTGDADTITGGTGAAVIITDGTEDAVTIAITGNAFAEFAYRHPIARAIGELQRRERVAPTWRGRFSGHRTADSAQPSPISTAIRIRSE